MEIIPNIIGLVSFIGFVLLTLRNTYENYQQNKRMEKIMEDIEAINKTLYCMRLGR